MEQLKPSEEAIIKLGKKLVKELDLEYSVNTLARWMAHYLAELIEKIEKAEPNEDKKILQQECCDVILKIWSQKENLPIKKPLDDLRPIIEILEVLKEKKETSILPRWIEYRKLPRDNQWASFVDLVKNAVKEENAEVLVISAKIESEIAELEDYEERAMFLDDLGLKESGVAKLILAAYRLLDLYTYFTAGVQEVRAWTITKGFTAPQAAGVIHSDFEKGFIRAEVIKYQDFVTLGSENACKEVGKLGVEGKTYVVEDGDIMHFRFNV